MLTEFIFYIFSYDIWFYISHLLLHTKHGYRLIHKHHHAVDYDTMNWKDTYVSHVVEGPLQGIGLVAPLAFVDFDFYTFGAALLFVNVRGMLRHDLRFVWLIGNHHLLHHKYPQHNFGEHWLDKFFRTGIIDETKYKKGLLYM